MAERAFLSVDERVVQGVAAATTSSPRTSTGSSTKRALCPPVNQIQLSPLTAQTELRAYHRRHSIVTQSWSPQA
ncbi:hypothetical protein [Streptomyces sp. 3213.3]|uniref:hypothetical protein n=1 Tax=Streptomyces sp. 3213.3 TaxID=1855348 RepID=UPI0010422B39|nr:hypothetical protein [Streptomyces sp. 3213.3]